MTSPDPRLAGFEPLIGTWATEATHPQFEGVVTGSTTYEWLAGGHFLIQRSHNDHESFPDAIAVIGAPVSGNGLVMEYFDSRGVRRTWGISLEGGTLRAWREEPGFDQRFTAVLGTDTFRLQSQLARSPGDWKDDLAVLYRREN